MSLKTIFLDLDDTLYPPSSGIWAAIGVRIDQYMAERLHIPADQVPALRRRLFSQYGTTIRGLVVTMHIDPLDYLDFVHAVPVGRMLQPDARLRQVLSALPPRKLILTNADRQHAGRVLDALQVTDCVEQIIDILDISPYCKPQAGAFECALRMAGAADPAECVLIDDGLPNLATARQLGFHTVRVGGPNPSPEYEVGISTIHDLPAALENWL